MSITNGQTGFSTGILGRDLSRCTTGTGKRVLSHRYRQYRILPPGKNRHKYSHPLNIMQPGNTTAETRPAGLYEALRPANQSYPRVPHMCLRPPPPILHGIHRALAFSILVGLAHTYSLCWGMGPIMTGQDVHRVETALHDMYVRQEAY